MTRLIDANALKEEFPKDEDWEYPVNTNQLVCETIDAQPTIDAVPHWIPCNERLPENMEHVNITWVNREPEPYYMNIKDKPFVATGIYFRGKWYWDSATCEDILGEYGDNEIDEVADGIEITAWMPLPEPYEVNNE